MKQQLLLARFISYRIQLKKRSVPLSLLQKRGTSSIYPERISSLNSNTYLTYAGEVGSMNWEMRMGERDGGVGVSHHVYLRTEGRDLKNLTFHFPSYQLSIGTPPQAFSMLFDTGIQ